MCSLTGKRTSKCAETGKTLSDSVKLKKIFCLPEQYLNFDKVVCHKKFKHCCVGNKGPEHLTDNRNLIKLTSAAIVYYS